MNTRREHEAAVVEHVFRRESTAAVAALSRAFRDVERAEEAVQDAYVSALERWPRDGVPTNPAAWIMRVARNRAIDIVRRERLARDKTDLLARLERIAPADDTASDDERVFDERLAMLFAACHPALNVESRLALTLKYATGLTTEEIARAFLVPEATLAQRLVRAKHKIASAGIAIEVPDREHLAQRLPDVLTTIYLLFNEGYASTSDDRFVRADICAEALRANELLRKRYPDDPSVTGLHALMLLQHARRDARVSESGEIVLLEEQDRTRWDRVAIARADALLASVPASIVEPYVLQARIAYEHARATSWERTDWQRILAHYDALLTRDDSPVVRLNRAVAVAFARDPADALAELDALAHELPQYTQLHVCRAELLTRLSRTDDARAAFAAALETSRNETQRRHIARALESMETPGMTSSGERPR